MFENYFGLFICLAIVGLMLTLFGSKKRQGAEDFPLLTQGGALFVVVGLFGTLSPYMSLTAILLLFVTVTGLIWAIDKVVLAQRRLCSKTQASLLVDYSRGFFPVLLAVFLLRSFLVEPFSIPSSSMRPELVVGDFILVNKFIYGIRLPVLNKVIIPVGKVERGDIMVFNFPMNPKINYIKRVIGLPGDRVEYRNKRLTINGQAVPDLRNGSYDYVDDQHNRLIHNGKFRESYGGKQYDVLQNSASPTLVPSQVMDFPDRDQCRYDDSGFACQVPTGKYFLMGDNRDGSGDSRYWGFVDDRRLVGKAFLIWMNLRSPSRIGTLMNKG